MVDQKQDFSTTLELLCEEFRIADELKEQKKQQKRSKRKARRQSKANEVRKCSNFHSFFFGFFFSFKTKSNAKCQSSEEKILLTTKTVDVKQDQWVNRRRSSSCCSCLCHYCDKRSNSLSIIHTTIPRTSLVKSHSCPTSLLLMDNSSLKSNSNNQTVKKEEILRLSSSLETLFSSISARECVCHERILGKKPNNNEIITRIHIEFVDLVLIQKKIKRPVMNVQHHRQCRVFAVRAHALTSDIRRVRTKRNQQECH